MKKRLLSQSCGHLGMLLWGVAYGLFFGAGIGVALQLVQVDIETGTA
jgi:hypothetical protein